MGKGGKDYRQLSPVAMFRDRLIPLCYGPGRITGASARRDAVPSGVQAGTALIEERCLE